MSKKSKFTNEEVYGLCCLIKAGNKEALEVLWEDSAEHIREYIYFNFYHNDSIDREELVNEGFFGFIKAVNKYNPAKGKFLTYLDWWLKDSISNYLKSVSGVIRVPIKKFDKITKVKNAMAELPEYMSTAQKYEEVAESLSISVAEVKECLIIDENCIYAVRLDEATDDEESTDRYDIVEDCMIPSPYAEAEKNCTISMMEELFKSLSKREREVVVFRFGFYGNDPLREADIARYFGVSRPYINRTLKSALKKLNSPFVRVALCESFAA